MQITVDDKEIYDGFVRMTEQVADIHSDMKDLKECVDKHGKRLTKLESGSKWKNLGVGSGAGAGATGLLAILYYFLDKLNFIGGK